MGTLNSTSSGPEAVGGVVCWGTSGWPGAAPLPLEMPRRIYLLRATTEFGSSDCTATWFRGRELSTE